MALYSSSGLAQQWLCIATLLLLTSVPCHSQEAGKLYKAQCAACHGAVGEGSLAFQAPPLAGSDGEYVVRQLQNFRAGIRAGSGPEDSATIMQAIALSIPDDKAVAALGRHINSLKAVPARLDARRVQQEHSGGKALYSVCMACHGTHAEGTPALKAPRISHLPAWYVSKQMLAFQTGQRGAHPSDLPGAQMRQIATELNLDAESIRLVSLYITTLAGSAKTKPD